MSISISRGDIHLVRFWDGGEGEPSGRRPAIIFSNNGVNSRMPSIMVIPTTTEITRVYEFQVKLENQRTDLDHDSKAQVELLTCVGRHRIGRKIGYVPNDLMEEIEVKVIEHLYLKKYTVV